MTPDMSPVSQFFEGASADIPPALLIVPIALAVVFLPLIDLMVSLGARLRR